MSHSGSNRFERHRKKIVAVFFGVLALALLGAGALLVKALHDEVTRGFERYIILREPRPFLDLAKHPSRELLSQADGLEDRAYRLRVDENGFIKPSKIHEKPDLSVVFLGGSTTECHYMGEEERFPFLVGRQLETSLGRKVNTYNSGMAGNNSLHCLFLLQGKVLPLRPQAVVFMECINDINYLMIMGDYWSNNPSRGIVHDKEYNPIKMMIIKYLKGGAEVSGSREDEFSGARQKGSKTSAADSAAQYRKNIELFIYICRQHGLTPVLMTQFNRYTEQLPPNLQRQMENFEKMGIAYDEYRKAYMNLNETLRNVAKEQKVLLIDLDRLVPKTQEFMYDVVHLNANGARFAAAIISQRLAEALR